MYLVTGKKGTPHVTSDDFAAMIDGIVGTDCTDMPFTVRQVEPGKIQAIACGLYWNGRFCVIEGNEILSFAGTSQGRKRIDSVCAHYTKTADGIEAVTLELVSGTEATNPTVPRIDETSYLRLVNVLISNSAVSTTDTLIEYIPSLNTVNQRVLNAAASACGTTDLLTIPANGNVSVDIGFPTLSASVPTRVVATLRGASGNARYCSVAVISVGDRVATLRAYNNHTAEVKMYVDWMAMQNAAIRGGIG